MTCVGEKMRNWNPYTQMVRMLNGSLEVSQKIKHRITVYLHNLSPWYMFKKQKCMYTKLIATLFIIAKEWQQTKCPSADE